MRDIKRESSVEPPSRDHIDALPPLGGESLAMDFSGLSLAIDGLDADLARAAGARFREYLVDAASLRADMRLSVHADPIEYYVVPDHGEKSEGYYRLRIVHEQGLIRLVTYGMAAWLDVKAGGGAASFSTGEWDPRERAFENLCRVAVAWIAVERGGFLIHGASIVRNGKAYIFFGRSASGKSTLASMNTEGTVISDDLSLVLPSSDGMVVAGTPFRGTWRGGPPVKGTFPLAAMFLLKQDTRTWVEQPTKIEAHAEFIANLPFVNDALHAHPGLMRHLDQRTGRVPLKVLRFRPHPEFWEVVDAASL